MRVSIIDRERVGVDTPRGRTTVRRVRPYRARVVVLPESFAGRVRRLRAERGLSQRALATLADMPRRTLSDCELGQLDVAARNVARLARAFGVTMDALYLGDGAP